MRRVIHYAPLFQKRLEFGHKRLALGMLQMHVESSALLEGLQETVGEAVVQAFRTDVAPQIR